VGSGKESYQVEASAEYTQVHYQFSNASNLGNNVMHDVIVYSRKGCHLCDIVKQTLADVQGDADFEWREVDIDADRELLQKFNDEVPVVFIDGRKAFKYRMDQRQFLRALEART
jgi:glutaredoxin